MPLAIAVVAMRIEIGKRYQYPKFRSKGSLPSMDGKWVRL